MEVNTLIPIGLSVIFATAIMASLFFKKGTSLPSRISLEELLKGDEKAAEMFCKSMLKYRFAVLKCNESTRKSIMEYKANGTQFFNLPTETKQSFCGKDKYEAPDGMIKRKVNKGYLVVDGVKEFLKLQISDPIESVPSQVQSSFKPLSTTFDSIAKKCLESIAKYKCEDGKSFMDMKFYEQLVQKLDKSSISYIHYFAMKESSPDDTNNDSEYRVTDDQDKDKIKEEGLTYPSKTHTDTGIMTFIICAEVSGLQVWSFVDNKWLQVEKLFNPNEDLFVILGRKTTLFYHGDSRDSPFRATTHRVALPLNTERNSLLYFVDVPQ